MEITSNLLKLALNLERCHEFTAKKISIDSRSTEEGDLFIAIEKGHQFVESAIKNGAVMAIIDNAKYVISNKTILVENTKFALKSIGNFIKLKSKLKKIVGITGSVGKTTTKSWLNTILNQKYNSFSSIKNYNTIYGLPISLSLLEKNIDFGIFEMGSNKVGEISELSKYLSPCIGVITNIYESHIGKFGNKFNIAKEKISVIGGMKEGGALVFDGDSEFASMIKYEADLRKIKTFSVGFSDDCDFSIISYKNSVKLKIPNNFVEYAINANGKHFVYISACVLAIIYAMGLDICGFLPFFKELSPIEGRGKAELYTHNSKTFTLIDDSYNASPSSLISSLEAFEVMPYKSKIVILGQMKELGDREGDYHKLVSIKLDSMNLFSVFFIGEKKLWDIMDSRKDVKCFENMSSFVIEEILKEIPSNSAVLLKGSRSVNLNQLIDYIKCSTM
ncbi:MAG: UDP-N-acetylmuramoyl-tripeptide--D-alanyl-D-alanine ligase [Holosporales bacterium]|jgi:UDP-N-acetylmuramoyl-tripeptide--D-alanyl-D-alanine ligase|nr:UDP-N-acetylmuramoyl-tripeptide--D-alanyl-D-alanine ligase [Holosporales bacterium]